MTSETFIVRQIAGIAARGCDVQIFATAEGSRDVPEIARRHGLDTRVRRLDPPRAAWRRIAATAVLLLGYGWRSPAAVLRSLSAARYGRAALSLRLLYSTLVLIRYGARTCDVVHAQFGPQGLYALQLAEIGALRGRLVTSFRGYDATKDLKARPQAYVALFRAGALFLPVSRALGEKIAAAGCPAEKIRVHHSGVECSRFCYSARTLVAGEPVRVVMVGRLVEKKGMRYGIEALGRVVASGRSVDCSIVGDGPLRAELERLIQEVGVAAHVRLLGALSHAEVITLMQGSHVLLAPSVTAADGDEEGIPNTVKEAMALGLPVLSTRHAGIPELVEDGVSGFLVPEGDSASLAARLQQLVDRPDTWAALGRAARRRIEEQFDIERLSDDLESLYESVVAAG